MSDTADRLRAACEILRGRVVRERVDGGARAWAGRSFSFEYPGFILCAYGPTLELHCGFGDTDAELSIDIYRNRCDGQSPDAGVVFTEQDALTPAFIASSIAAVFAVEIDNVREVL